MATATKRDNNTSDNQEVFAFTLVLSGFYEITPELENTLFEAGCDDALLGIHGGVPYLAFDREAKSLDDAIKSAIKAVEQVQASGMTIEVVRVIRPGEDTIEKFNAYLNLRRQWLLEFKTIQPDVRDRMIQVLASLLEHDPDSLKKILTSK